MIDPGYRITVVPDIILSDGTVQHGLRPTSLTWLMVMRRSVWDSARKLVTAAEDRPMTVSEIRQWGRLLAELTTLDEQIRKQQP